MTLLFRGTSLALLLLLGLALRDHPAALAFSLLLLIHSVLQFRYPTLWLSSVPALLPVLDWSPWTGWTLAQEFDLFLLAVCAVGYWQASRQTPSGRFGFGSRALIALYALSWSGALVLSLRDTNIAALHELGSVVDINVLRGAKAFSFSLLLIPLLRRAWQGGAVTVHRRFAFGALIGLALTSLSVILERWLFPGLTDFSADYRAVGPFFEMYAGGAALDCFIALTLPLAMWPILRPRVDWILLSGTVVLALGSYAAFTTFSRGVYLAYAFSAVSLGYSFSRISAYRVHSTWPLIWIACSAVPLWYLFQAGGYRALLSALALGLATLAITPRVAIQRGAIAAVIGLSAIMLTSVALLYYASLKGVYWATAVAASGAALGAGGLVLHWRHARALQIAGVIGLALCTPLVSHFWRAEGGWWPALAWVGFCSTTWLLARARQWWQHSLAELVIPAGIISVLTFAIPIAGGYYMTQRISTASQDLQGRFAHWSSVIALVDSSRAMIFGQGVGRFVQQSFHHNDRHEVPGFFTVLNDDSRYVRLSAARYMSGYGEVIRLGQRISGTAAYPLSFSAVVRSAAPKGQLILQACDKWLLYPSACNGATLTGLTTDWQQRTIAIPGPRIEDRWSGLRPRQFSLSTSDTNDASDIDLKDILLIDATGKLLLSNTDFYAGLTHWAYTSDRHHLPWHAKNMWLHVYFEQGWCGVVLYSLLLLSAIVVLLRKIALGNQVAPLYIAAIIGTGAVGLFDSLLDFTRIACLIFLLLWISMMVDDEPHRRRRRRRTRHATH